MNNTPTYPQPKSHRIVPLVVLSLIVITIVLLITRAPSASPTLKDTPQPPRISVSCVTEWDTVPYSQATIPRLTKAQILTQLDKSIKACQALHSWQATYHVTSHQPARKHATLSIPEVTTESQPTLITSASRWHYQEYLNGQQAYSVAANGKAIRMLWPNTKEGRLCSIGATTPAYVSSLPTPSDFLPFLPTASSFPRNRSVPDILEVLGDPNLQLLPWCALVNGRLCSVLEHTTTQTQPIFRSQDEAPAWKKTHPQPRSPGPTMIDSRAKPDYRRVDKTTIRLAIDPKVGFMIVRWASGFDRHHPRFHLNIFPRTEITYSDFRTTPYGPVMPHQMEFTNYVCESPAQSEYVSRTKLLLERFEANRQYPSELFEPNFPKGYSLTDNTRDITYTVGDPNAQLELLVRARQRRTAFYDQLRRKPAPPLEYSQWLNTDPIRLANHKGRPIILHFWSVACAPCIHELPRLQQQHRHTMQYPAVPLFISVHPFASGTDLDLIKKTIEKYNLTFPVMVDAADPDLRSWGKTCKHYAVASVPTEVTLDPNGHFSGIDAELITAHSRWMKDSHPTRPD